MSARRSMFTKAMDKDKAVTTTGASWENNHSWLNRRNVRAWERAKAPKENKR